MDPKKTDWESHKIDIKENFGDFMSKLCSLLDGEFTVPQLQKSIFLSCHQNCPTKVIHSPR
jgi:hypothetical protein